MVVQINPRQQQIMDRAQQSGFVAIESLSREFGVTSQTIRRDINHLCGLGMLLRYHGGAGLPTSAKNIAYVARRDHLLSEKQSIAALAAAQIPDHSSLFINIGTTNEEVARALMAHHGLRIITNNLNVAHLMSAKQDFDQCFFFGSQEAQGARRALEGGGALTLGPRGGDDRGQRAGPARPPPRSIPTW